MVSPIRSSRKFDIEYSLFYDDGYVHPGLRQAPEYTVIVTHWHHGATDFADPLNYHRGLLRTNSVTEAVSVYHEYVMGRRTPATDLPIIGNMRASDIFSWEHNPSRQAPYTKNTNNEGIEK